MGRPKKSPPAHIEPEYESQEAPEEEPVGEEESESLPRGAVSQTVAARAALDAGHEKPAEAVKYIKEKFGIDMNPQYFSSIKARTKGTPEEASKKAAAAAPKSKPVRKPKAAPSGIENHVVSPQQPKAAGEPDILLALENVKELVGQFGAEKLKRMVDLLG